MRELQKTFLLLLTALGMWVATVIPIVAQQKLVFKDGSIEKVEQFEVKGDRVRFKSIERNEWEEVPLSLVDLDATKKLNEKEAQEQKKTKAQPFTQPINEAKSPEPSPAKKSGPVEIAPGVNMPDAYGVYVWDGKQLRQLTEAGTRKHTDRKNTIINLVAPVPIMKQKVSIQLDGLTSDTKLATAAPVFYAYLPDERGGQISLYKMIVTKTDRVLKETAHSQITGSDTEKSQEFVFTPSLHIAENVYKIFPTKPLEEGEYCLVEISAQQMKYEPTVWDFSIPKQ